MASKGTIEATDGELLNALRGGTDAALMRIHERYVRPVYRCVLRVLADSAEADECTQDVFLLLWKKRSTVAVYDESILPWLLTTAKYLALNRLRKQQRRRNRETVLSENDAQGRDPLATVADLETIRCVREAIAALTDTDQAIVSLCITHEMSYEEAAVRLGITHGAVRNRLSRARRELKRTLARHRNGGENEQSQQSRERT